MIVEFRVEVDDDDHWPVAGARPTGRPIAVVTDDGIYDVSERGYDPGCSGAIAELRQDARIEIETCGANARCEESIWNALNAYVRNIFERSPFVATETKRYTRRRRVVFERRGQLSEILGRPYLEAARYTIDLDCTTNRRFDPETPEAVCDVIVEAFILVKKNPSNDAPYRDPTSNEFAPYESAVGRLDPVAGICPLLRGEFRQGRCVLNM